jgi:hypothetical protein
MEKTCIRNKVDCVFWVVYSLTIGIARFFAQNYIKVLLSATLFPN